MLNDHGTFHVYIAVVHHKSRHKPSEANTM